MTRLALGTVQFGQRYGVANATGQVSAESAAHILTLARRSGMDTLDTAIAYGSSEQCLGEIGVAQWRVISKLPPLPDGVTDVAQWAEVQVLASLKRLRVQQLDALLLHRPADLLGPRAQEVIAALDAIEARGWARSVGISVYSPGDLDAVFATWVPQIVQAPCNILDRRLIRSGWLARLAQRGVRVHIRSVLLQGLLLLSATQRPEWFLRWSGLLDRWLQWCCDCAVTPLQAALAFAQALPDIERIVIGVDSLAHLDEILSAADGTGSLPPEDLYSEDPDLLDPSRWKLT